MTNILIVIIILLSCILSFIAGSFFMWIGFLHELKKDYVPKNSLALRYCSDEPNYQDYLPRDRLGLSDFIKDFNPFVEYPEEYPTPKDFKIMTDKRKKQELHMLSDLIANMIIKDAHVEEMSNAVKYSMVILRNSEDHRLHWVKAYKDFNIEELKKKYL